MEEVIINEEWKNITGYSNYQVSNLGRLRNITTDYILNPSTDTKGFLYVGLCQNGTKQIHKVHKLVGQEFIHNPDNKPILGHIDAKARHNNNIDNLRWYTHSEQYWNIKGSRESNQDLPPSGSGSGSGSSTK